ncbi:helix-turn-helix domain-containing protein [Gordonibacter urolithinfaciens]|uniref:helix-turn-helix domain-containing protein n=1 Tax=Gordonibacter urolithinfaciens TaxID=1335613 RepID=UPI003AAFFB0D
MGIVSRLDRVMTDRSIGTIQLAEKLGITPVNLSRIKTGKTKSIRYSTLEALCRELECQPGDLLEYKADGPK